MVFYEPGTFFPGDICPGGKIVNVLYDRVSGEIAGLSEPVFVDSVIRNLARGRFLVLVVGDGIREGVENISDFLQRHAGLDFTFGLVELGIYKVPGDESFMVQPRTLAKTCTIERAVIRIEEGTRAIESPEVKRADGQALGKRKTISEAQFFENLKQPNELLAGELIALIEALSALDIFPVFRKTTMNLHWQATPDLQMNFGCFYLDGKVDTFYTNWLPDKIGKISIGLAYQEKLAGMIEGAYLVKPDTSYCAVHYKEKPIEFDAFLGAREKWLGVVEETQGKVLDVLNG